MKDHNLSREELDSVVRAALGELLNLAAGVAELQTSDESAEEIYAVCDLVAEYYMIERAVAVTEEHEDGSYTTHFETHVGGGPDSIVAASTVETPARSASIRTAKVPTQLTITDITDLINNRNRDTDG